MKLDEIIETLVKVRDNNPLTDTGYLADLMLELAHHVKAQEPEDFTEEELMALAEEDKRLVERMKHETVEEALNANMKEVARGLKK